MNRALRAATMGALLISPIGLGACSAGQVTQTVTQDRDKVGASVELGDIVVRQLAVSYPEDEGRYVEGADVEMIMAIVNTGTEADALVDISGDAFEGVVVDDGTDLATADTDVDITIPPKSVVYVREDGDYEVALTDVQRALTTGLSVEMTLTFAEAGEATVEVPVAAPEEALERGEEFDFHHEEEGAGEQSAEEVARERESEAGGGPGGSAD